MIKLLVDSAADFTNDDLKANNIAMIPLQISANDETYLDNVTITKDEFYDKLCNQKYHFKTSQPSPNAFLDAFEKVKESGDTLLCLMLSSKLSGTYQSAMLAKNIVEYENIYIVDTQSATAGIQFLAERALEMIHANLTIELIIQELEEMKQHVRIFASVDTLEYLHRGGRISKASAIIGSVAKVKPVITVDEGSAIVASKKVGVHQTMHYIIEQMNTLKVHPKYPVKTLMTSGDKHCQQLEKMITQANYTIGKRVQVGSTIGTHIGPDAFGAVFIETY